MIFPNEVANPLHLKLCSNLFLLMAVGVESGGNEEIKNDRQGLQYYVFFRLPGAKVGMLSQPFESDTIAVTSIRSPEGRVSVSAERLSMVQYVSFIFLVPIQTYRQIPPHLSSETPLERS